MGRIKNIQERLSSLQPTYMEIIDDTMLHLNHQNVKVDIETHIRLKISSNMLQGKSRIIQHRIIHNLLKDEFESGLHALSILVL
jgi:BolA protein